MIELEGKNVLITGATSRIGQPIAIRLAEARVQHRHQLPQKP